jgi:hypothetical protein
LRHRRSAPRRFAPRWTAAALLGLTIAGCGLTRPKLVARRVPFVPDPNRVIERESLWKDAKPVTIELQRPWGGETRRVVLRAIHDGAAVCFLAIWSDASGRGRVQPFEVRSSRDPNAPPRVVAGADDARRAWVWAERGQGYNLQEMETDLFAFRFPIAGPAEACMLSGDEGISDVWEWRSGWTDRTSAPTLPFGFAEDRLLIITRQHPQVESYKTYTAGDGSRVYLRWLEDRGVPPYALTARPTQYQGRVVPGLIARGGTESQIDVLAAAVHQEGQWLLEIKRRLETGFSDDYQFRGPGPHAFAIALTDEAEGAEHYTSGLIDLYLN